MTNTTLYTPERFELLKKVIHTIVTKNTSQDELEFKSEVHMDKEDWIFVCERLKKIGLYYFLDCEANYQSIEFSARIAKALYEFDQTNPAFNAEMDLLYAPIRSKIGSQPIRDTQPIMGVSDLDLWFTRLPDPDFEFTENQFVQNENGEAVLFVVN